MVCECGHDKTFGLVTCEFTLNRVGTIQFLSNFSPPVCLTEAVEQDLKDLENIEGIGRTSAGRDGLAHLCRADGTNPRRQMDRTIIQLLDVCSEDFFANVKSDSAMDRKAMTGVVSCDILVSGRHAPIAGSNAWPISWAVRRSLLIESCLSPKYQVIACVQGSYGR